MKYLVHSAVCLIAACWMLLGCANGAEGEPEAAGTGAITGKVVFEGRAPKMRPVPTAADPKCAEMHKDDPLLTDFLILGEGQTMANIIVQVKNPPAGDYPAPAEPATLSQKGCQYNPHVLAVRKGQTIKILNPDAMQHNVHFMPEVNREFNRAMAAQLLEISFTAEEAEPVFKIKCDVHAWMSAYCAVFDHPFYQVTAPDGLFRIDNLPPGEYELEAWHEVLGTKTAKVTVKDGEETVVDFTYTRPQ